jgi:hypothetical protein
MIDTLHRTEILLRPVIPHHEEASRVFVFWVDVHDEVLDVFEFLGGSVVVLQQLLELG